MRKNRKLIIVFVLLIILSGCQAGMKIAVRDVITCEYGEELTMEKLLFIERSDRDIRIDTIEGFDQRKIGVQQVKVHLVNANHRQKELSVAVKVEDNKDPQIQLKQDVIQRAWKEALQLESNIVFVKDPVDGALPYSKKPCVSNGFFFTYDADAIEEPGIHEIKVTAYDKNGRKAETSFQLNRQAEQKKPQAEVTDSGLANELPSKQAIPQQPAKQKQSKAGIVDSNKQQKEKQPPAIACGLADTTISSLIGNSGKLFKTFEEARSWAEGIWMEMDKKWQLGQITKEESMRWDGWDEYTLRDSCGDTYWTVHWKYQ